MRECAESAAAMQHLLQLRPLLISQFLVPVVKSLLSLLLPCERPLALVLTGLLSNICARHPGLSRWCLDAQSLEYSTGAFAAPC